MHSPDPRSIWRQATSGGWVGPTRAFIRGVPSAVFQERNDEFVREVRDPIDKLLTWGVAVLAIGMAVGYQVLRHTDAHPRPSSDARKVTPDRG